MLRPKNTVLLRTGGFIVPELEGMMGGASWTPPPIVV